MQEVSVIRPCYPVCLSSYGLHQGTECSLVVSRCPETQAVHPSPTWWKLVYKRHLGHSAISQITYPTLQSKCVVLLCPFSVPESWSQFSLSTLFSDLKKESQDQFTLRKNERHAVANLLTIKSWGPCLCPTRKQGGNRTPRVSELWQPQTGNQSCRHKGARSSGHHLQQSIVSSTMKQRPQKAVCGFRRTVPN